MTRALCVLVVVLMAGCADKLHTESAFALPDGGNTTKIFDLPAQKADQTIKVGVTSDKPVDVFIMPATDTPNLEGLPTKEWQTKSLTFKENVTSDTLTAKVKANQATKVIVTLSAKTQNAQVKVTLTN